MGSTATDLVASQRRTRFGSTTAADAIREYTVPICFVLLFVVLAITSDVFLTPGNLLNVLSQQSYVLIIAVAGVLVLIAGGIDISIGSVLALSSVVSAQVANSAGPAAGVLTGLSVGAAVGFINGLLTTFGRIDPFIGTLATSFGIAGVAAIISGGQLVLVADPAWRVLGNDGIGAVRYSVLVMLGFVAVAWFLLNRTVFGRKIFATGGNQEAAWLSGIRINWVRCVTYVISGLAAGLGGVIVSSQVGVGQADTGSTLLFSVIAGIVVGGASIMGGQGSVLRTCIGVLFIALVNNGFTLLGFDPLYEQIVKGAIILTAVAADVWTRRSP